MRLALALCLVSTVAHAQTGVPTVDDWNTKALATYAGVATLAIAFLVREVLAGNRARLDDTRAFAESLAQAREKSAVLVQRLSDFTGTLEELVRLITSEK